MLKRLLRQVNIWFLLGVVIGVTATVAVYLVAKRIERLESQNTELQQQLILQSAACRELVAWPASGLDWMTLLHPEHRPVRYKGQNVIISTTTSAGTEVLAEVGPDDMLFIGRTNQPN